MYFLPFFVPELFVVDFMLVQVTPEVSEVPLSCKPVERDEKKEEMEKEKKARKRSNST